MPQSSNLVPYTVGSPTGGSGEEMPLTVATCQYEVKLGQIERNQQTALSWIDKAVDEGAELILLPELCNSGYIFSSRKECYQYAEEVPEGPTVSLIAQKAKDRNVHIVFGVNEIDRKEKTGSVHAYNCGVLVGPMGYIGKYRKAHLWGFDKLFWEPGNLGFPVFDLPFGRIGMYICYDGWHPEGPRLYALQGVDIICYPTNWLLVPGFFTPENPLSPMHIIVNAHCNNIFYIACDRIGTERGVTFLGMSVIAGPRGAIVGPGSYEKEELLIARINVIDARKKIWTPFHDLLADRRVDLYDPMLGYTKHPPLPQYCAPSRST